MFRLWTAAACIAVVSTATVQAATAQTAQTYPEREIKAAVGFVAGSGADVIARYFTEKMRPLAGKPVIIENKPGAQSSIAAEYVARSKPDGYTLYITGVAAITLNMHLFKKIGYDPVKDFTPIAPLLVQPFILVTPANGPIRTVADLTADLKKKGNKASYAASASLSVASAELYKRAIGVDVVRVSYREANSAMNDMMAGSIDLFFADPVVALEQARSGRIRALAVTTAERVKAIPELPTMAETGVENVVVSSWWSVYAPAGTPPDIIQKINGWIHQIQATEETRKFLASFGADPFVSTPEQLRQHHLKEIEHWAKIAAVAQFETQ
jgi:tripartite-type tricarboxylate transporter receptor subunit TctC